MEERTLQSLALYLICECQAHDRVMPHSVSRYCKLILNQMTKRKKICFFQRACGHPKSDSITRFPQNLKTTYPRSKRNLLTFFREPWIRNIKKDRLTFCLLRQERSRPPCQKRESGREGSQEKAKQELSRGRK